MPENRKSATDQIFAEITKQIDSGTIPWHKPWVSQPSRIINHYKGTPYTSIRNRMLIGCAGEYATMHQINAEGGRVNKGSHGYRVYFAKHYDKKIDDENTESRYVLRAFTVFHISDTTLQPKFAHIWSAEPPSKCEASDIMKDYSERSGVGIRWGGDEAHYSPSHNYVIVPSEKDFFESAAFWGAVFHELGHSTMNQLNRKFDYAKEELVAELCACLCVGALGMTPTVANSAAYINSWKSKIRELKPTDFADACREAERAYKYIFNVKEKENDTDD